MFTEKIPVWTQDLMDILGPLLPENSYLAGGTGLALHLNHRSSYDLDLYVPKLFNEHEIVQKFEAGIPDFSLISQEWQTVIGSSKDTEISLFVYQYMLLEPTLSFKSIHVASLSDIASMKLEAVGNRGLKRDFFDLYTICQLEGWSLGKIVDLTIQKYHRKESDLPHLFKSLIYFDDAEQKPERAQIVDETWQNVKQFFLIETPQLLRKYLQSD